MLWQWISRILSLDPHSSIILLNDVFLFLAIGLCYRFIRKSIGERTALIATILIVSNPVVLYYAAVAEIYIYDLFFSVGILYAMSNWKAKFIPLAFFLLGIAMGFRLSSVILLFPVILFVLWQRQERKEIFSFRIVLSSFLLLCIGASVWLIPFYVSEGGFASVEKALHNAADLGSTIFQNAAVYFSYLLWSVNLGIFVFLIRKKKEKADAKKKIMLLSWFIIPTLFFIFQHYAKGYILLIFPPLILPIAGRLSKIEASNLRRSLVSILTAANLILFFFTPFISPSIESALPKAQRSSSERLQTAFFRSLSFFAPTYSHIAISDAAMMEADTLIMRNSPPHSHILIDNSASVWAFPRSLQAHFSSRVFIQPNSMDTALMAVFYSSKRGSEVDRTVQAESILQLDTLYYLIDPQFVKTYGTPPDAMLLISGSYLSLYEVTAKNKDLFWKYCRKSK